MKKRVIIALITILFLLTGVYFYVMFGGKRDLESEKPSFTIATDALSKEYKSNIDASNKKYLEKAVVITGKIVSVKAKEVILENAIVCNLKNADTSLKENQQVTIKGRVVGYDDLMEEIKLDQCFIIKNQN